MNYLGTTLIPPRPEAKAPSSLLNFYEERGWVAQRKRNGTNTVVYISPKGEITAKNRAGEPHKAWSFTDKSRAAFEKIANGKWAVLNAELMHSKGPSMRDSHFIHDVLVWDGELLLGSTYQDRHGLLQGIFKARSLPLLGVDWIVDDQTLLAGVYRRGFLSTYEGLSDPLDEGLVLKMPSGKLTTRCHKNASWIAKCRRIHKNFSF